MDKLVAQQIITTSHNPFQLGIEELPKRGRYGYPPMTPDEIVSYLATVLESYPTYKELQYSIKSNFSKDSSEKLEYLKQLRSTLFNINIPEISYTLLEIEATTEGSRDNCIRVPLNFIKHALIELLKNENTELNKLSERNLVLTRELLEGGGCTIDLIGKVVIDSYLILLQSCYGANLEFGEIIEDNNIKFNIALETIINTKSFRSDQQIFAKAIVCVSKIFGLQNVFVATE
jgi:hypothetical protein